MKILVVEDEQAVAELLQAALANLGLSCHVAEDADIADRILKRHDVDAVTLDLGMPGRSGLDWLESVATSRPDLARKTLVITGMSLEREQVERLAKCGAGVLTKPFTLAGLSEAIRTQIDHSPAARLAD